jgi:hypothetical protein
MRTLESLDIFATLTRSGNVSDDELAKLYHIHPGGSWTPPNCTPTLQGTPCNNVQVSTYLAHFGPQFLIKIW